MPQYTAQYRLKNRLEKQTLVSFLASGQPRKALDLRESIDLESTFPADNDESAKEITQQHADSLRASYRFNTCEVRGIWENDREIPLS
jgi:hypothetical protein